MQTEKIRDYVERYLTAHDSHFIEKNPAYFTVTLPEQVDKDLENRPFYWSYIERCGIEPTSVTMTFVFDRKQVPDGIKGEWVGFGSRRLQQIFRSAETHGRFVRLYELTPNGKEIASPFSSLVPWLCVHYRAQCVCDQKKDILFSIGINLVTKEVHSSFFKRISHRLLTPKLPPYRFTMQPIFSLRSAVERAEQSVTEQLAKEDKTWAEKALRRLEEEKQLLQNYYLHQSDKDEGDSSSPDEYRRRLQELQWQYQPRIDVQFINAGLFYLSPAPALE